MTSFIILIILVPIIAMVLVVINYILAPHRPIFNKKGTYECGLLSRANQSRQPFSVLFYIVAVLFMIFDLEILLLWPLSLVLSQVGIYGFWVATVFFAVVTLGFVVELATGALNFAKS